MRSRSRDMPEVNIPVPTSQLLANVAKTVVMTRVLP